ncbi:MAG: glycosyltransferase, partial [Actinobacteria bacterium]
MIGHADASRGSRSRADDRRERTVGPALVTCVECVATRSRVPIAAASIVRDALLVTPVTPAAGGNGLAMRAGLFLEGLSRSFRVRCLVVPVFGSAGRSDGLVDRLAATSQVLALDPVPDAVQDLRVRLAAQAPRARAIAVHPRPALCRSATMTAAHALADAAAGVEFVHIHRLYLAPFLDVLLDRQERPVLTIDIDDDEAATRRACGEPDEAEAYERLGNYYLPAVDHVFAASAIDAATVATTYKLAAVTPISNAVRLPPLTGKRGRSRRAPTHDLLLVGTLSYPPNAEAARWLCEEVLPHLNHASVALVGSNPPPEVRALARDSSVTVVGAVADVTSWYERTRVAVVPLRAGGGTRIKLLEALAHGRPVVSTTVGVHGLDFLPGRDGVLVADRPAEFAAHCQSLMDEPEFAERLAVAGRDVVARTASIEVVARDSDRIFRSLLRSRSEDAAISDRVVALGAQLHRNRVAAETCHLLTAAGVRAILLKGASFGAWLYDSLLDRSCADIDLLIDPVAEPVAQAVLARHGFTTLHGRSNAMLLGHPAVEWVRGHDHVDLHRGRFWGITVPPDEAWLVLSEHTERFELGGRQVETLNVTARAFHVVVHAVASGPTSEQPREDLRRALERVPLSIWQDAARLAAVLGAQAGFTAGLELTTAGRDLSRCLVLDGRAALGRLPSLDAALRVAGPPRFATGMARLLALPGL